MFSSGSRGESQKHPIFTGILTGSRVKTPEAGWPLFEPLNTFSASGHAPRRLAFNLRLPDTSPVPLTVTQLTDRLVASYAREGGINHLDGKNLPSKSAITLLTVDLLRLLFPGFFDETPVHSSEIKV